MLADPTPFPAAGSYGLHAVGGTTRLARIIARNRDGSVIISIPSLPGASGNRCVPLDQVRDGTPLTDEERAEQLKLAASLRSIARPGPAARRRRARLDALREREIDARLLGELLRARAA